jgi:mono/diheme cytochrome c family protein
MSRRSRIAFTVALLALPLALLFLLASAPVRADDDEDDEGRRPVRAPMPAVYVEECGSCHVPYPARGLPASSWRALMAGLGRHFGNDASLAPAQADTIRNWLVAGAGTQPVDPAMPLRLTRSPWFIREHREVPTPLWRSPAVKSAANCAACHRGAERGTFSEHDVRLPRASPRSSTGARP